MGLLSTQSLLLRLAWTPSLRLAWWCCIGPHSSCSWALGGECALCSGPSSWALGGEYALCSGPSSWALGGECALGSSPSQKKPALDLVWCLGEHQALRTVSQGQGLDPITPCFRRASRRCSRSAWSWRTMGWSSIHPWKWAGTEASWR